MSVTNWESFLQAHLIDSSTKAGAQILVKLSEKLPSDKTSARELRECLSGVRWWGCDIVRE